ncbi:MAG: hypothetical protein NTU61_04585 [Candidatus Altiarchaeota archaeon]|nr:hypothetical protein [Candidatus Altiarchaeota archaeon]
MKKNVLITGMLVLALMMGATGQNLSLDNANAAEATATGTTDEKAVNKSPYCYNIGSKSEGWYFGGDLIRYDTCKGCYAVCKLGGSKSEGWYSSCDGKLIKYATCGTTTTTSPARRCVGVGEKGSIFQGETCCTGLTQVSNSFGSEGMCVAPTDGSFVCVKYGDGICGEGENACNSPKDCKEQEGGTEQEPSECVMPESLKTEYDSLIRRYKELVESGGSEEDIKAVKERISEIKNKINYYNNRCIQVSSSQQTEERKPAIVDEYKKKMKEILVSGGTVQDQISALKRLREDIDQQIKKLIESQTQAHTAGDVDNQREAGKEEGISENRAEANAGKIDAPEAEKLKETQENESIPVKEDNVSWMRLLGL